MKIPRPMGATIKAQNLRTSNPDQLQNNISEYINYILKIYIMQGFQLNQEPIDLIQLSQMLNISLKRLIHYLNNQRGMYFDVEDRDVIKEGLGIMVQKMMEGTIRDRFEVEENVREMKKALINKDGSRAPYKAFISAEYSKALQVQMASISGMNQMAQLLMKLANLDNGQKGPTIQINNQNQLDQSTNNKVLTTEAAMALLAEDKGQLQLSSGMEEAIKSKYLSGEMPDLNPNTQKGFGSDRSIVGIKASKANVKKFSHDERREGLNEILP